jgi:hypothetical protein
MQLIFLKTYLNIKTLTNIFFINLVILYYINLKKKKVIFFYHPRNQLTKIHLNYTEELFSILTNKYLIIYGHTVFGMNDRHYYFIKEGFLKFIFNIKIFISNNVCDNFTYKSKKIYIHHDIYDSPLIDPAKKNELVKRLLNYNYLFLPNFKTVLTFKKYINSFKNKNKNKKLIKIFDVGYFKLDFLKRKIAKYKTKEDSVVIALTDIRHIKSMSLIKEIPSLIHLLLRKTNLKIIFRPYPANRMFLEILEIKNQFKNFKKFIFDDSNDYFKTYIASKCLITDISGTAYTYAFLKKKPVIFFTKYEKILNKYKFSNLNYFKDRKKIGFLSLSQKDTLQLVLNIDKFYNVKNKSIIKLEKEFNYIDKSQIRITNLIENMY